MVINVICALPQALKNAYSALNLFQNIENDISILHKCISTCVMKQVLYLKETFNDNADKIS